MTLTTITIITVTHATFTTLVRSGSTASTKKRDEVECFLIDLERRAYELFP